MDTASLALQMSYGLPLFKLFLVKEGASPDIPLRVRIGAPEDVLDFIRPLFHAAEEHFITLHLNARNEVTGVHEVSHGTLSSSLVHPREVYKAAFIANSHSLMVCHNHPSGARLSPSQEDLATTTNLIEAGVILGVSLLDHIIVGGPDRRDWYSIREHYPELWL
ncbi:MAG: JAB domain-containing protein [Cyanobacteriota/Melainabacteria group bacterium]